MKIVGPLKSLDWFSKKYFYREILHDSNETKRLATLLPNAIYIRRFTNANKWSLFDDFHLFEAKIFASDEEAINYFNQFLIDNNYTIIDDENYIEKLNY